MKLKSLAILLVVAALSVSTSARSNPTRTEKDAATKAGEPAKPVIGLGMSPEEVQKIIGKPDKVEPVKTEVGEGEQWTYRRLSRKWTQQTAATVDMVPSFVGLALPNEGIGVATLPAHRVENIEEFQVSTLLFIDGKLAAAKQWFEKESRIEN